VRRFERDVPQHAAIALWLPPDSFEYPLFGLHVDRRIVPVGDHPLADPAAATDYLVFSSALMDPRATDTHLGEDWWLRAR
jgi:hypothetical protein